MIVLIPDAVFDDDGLEQAAAAPDEIVLRRANAAAEIGDAEWQAADAVVGYTRVNYDADVCRRLSRCRILVRAGVGLDNVDIPAFTARGIPVCNVPDYGINEVADHAIALLLTLGRGIIEYHRGIAEDSRTGWDWRRWPAPVRRLGGRKLLLIGLGTIGMAVARRALPLGLDIGFYDPARPAGIERELGLTRYDDLDRALVDADIVSLHAALTAATRHLIDGRRLALMKPGAMLINTARGGLVDLDAVTEALRRGHLGAAGLDVLEEEPPDPAHPLFVALKEDAPWLRSRIAVTPHAAFLSAEAIRDMRRKAVETAVNYLRTGDLAHCANAAAIRAKG